MTQCCGSLDRKIAKKNPHLLLMGEFENGIECGELPKGIRMMPLSSIVKLMRNSSPSGTRDGDGNLVPTFIMEWRRGSDAFKKSIKKMQKINCANPAVVENNPLDPVTGRKILSGKKDRQHDSTGRSQENDEDSMETKKEQPKIQFDLSENFKREMELHDIAVQQEKEREEQERREQRRKDRRRKLERKKPETSRTDEDVEGKPCCGSFKVESRLRSEFFPHCSVDNPSMNLFFSRGNRCAENENERAQEESVNHDHRERFGGRHRSRNGGSATPQRSQRPSVPRLDVPQESERRSGNGSRAPG